jgi:NAD(P)H-hydrate epimerase
MLLTASQMKAAEEELFTKGATAEALMECAAEGISGCVRQFFPTPATAIVYCGKGNNGGDALAVARLLNRAGWRIFLRLSSSGEAASLPHLQLERVMALGGVIVADSLPAITGEIVLIDGLLGIGSEGAPHGTTLELIHEMNLLRKVSGGFTVAIDLPSGLDSTTGEIPGECVQADLTVTIGAPKTGLVADSATAVVGRLALVPLPGLTSNESDSADLITSISLRPLLPIRDFDSYKGSYGHLGILAGSAGYFGAARLCSAAAVHAGAGLVTLYALPEYHDLLVATCVPEVMVQRISSYTDIPAGKLDALSLGPGLGQEHHEALLKLVRDAPIPCVVDAGALNAIATYPTILFHCHASRLLTPHPGEMERLFPREARMRREWAADFVSNYPVTLLLKGSRTIIAEKGEPFSFNCTGNPGMGSGGMGDVLTGVAGALIAAGKSCREAAMLGAWLCGRAAELAIFSGRDSQESLAASSVIEHLGGACRSLRKGDF